MTSLRLPRSMSDRGLSAQLRRLDPVEAAVRDATENLRAILGQSPVTAIANEYGDTGTMPDAIVQFCLDHDLLEVLYSLQHYSYTIADLRRDRYPGFFHRRLRPLALSGEQLASGILDARAERGHEKSLDHHRSGYRDLVKILGQDSSWLAPFRNLKTSDGSQGDLDNACGTSGRDGAHRRRKTRRRHREHVRRRGRNPQPRQPPASALVVPRSEGARWAVCRRGGLDLAYCSREGSRVAQRACGCRKLGRGR